MIVASIICRAGSKRVKDKALQAVGGITLLEHAIACARMVPAIGRVVVSTDGKAIADEARRHGADVLMRPYDDGSSKWRQFRYFAEHIPAELIVDLDVGCPFRQPEDVEACIKEAYNYDVVCTAYEADRNPYFNMVEKKANGQMEIVCRTLPPVQSGQDAPVVYALSPAVYAFRPEVLWQYDHWSLARLGIHIIPRERAWDIDTEFDLMIARLNYV